MDLKFNELQVLKIKLDLEDLPEFAWLFFAYLFKAKEFFF